MIHPFENYLVCRDNYLNNPAAAINLADRLEYKHASEYPGKRTDNLMASNDMEVREFGKWFADRLSYNVFPGISMYEITVSFHINEVYEHPELNSGWIHNDIGNLAGLVYLTPDESNLDAGTSIFNGYAEELPDDAEARRKFHFTGEVTPEYLTGFKRNQIQFKETIRIGNQFNRLIAYDSKMFHRPNSFITSTGAPRLTLLFFISKFNYEQQT